MLNFGIDNTDGLVEKNCELADNKLELKIIDTECGVFSVDKTPNHKSTKFY